MTSIFVTHDQTEANALADRVAVMEGGVLQQLANQTELKERPANLYVATFIGEPPMNVFDATRGDWRASSLPRRERAQARFLGQRIQRRRAERHRQAQARRHRRPAA